MISIVVASISEERFGRVAEQYAAALRGEEFELVRIADAKGLCEGYTRGLGQTRGEIVIFSHDDIEFLEPELFAGKLLGYLREVDVVGVAGTSRLVGPSWVAACPPEIFGQVLHPFPNPAEKRMCLSIYGVQRPFVKGIHAMDGLFLAFRRKCIEAVGWDAETFDGFHLYDIDTTYRAYRAGFKLGVAADLRICHHSGGKFDEVWKKYAERFQVKHGATLATTVRGPAQFSVRFVNSREEGLEAMRPPHWPGEAKGR